MRRPPVLAALVLAIALALPATAVSAQPAQAPDTILAVAAEPLGPEPAERMREDNPARTLAGYEDRELPYTWGAAWLLLLGMGGGLATMLVVYRLKVQGPAKKARS